MAGVFVDAVSKVIWKSGSESLCLYKLLAAAVNIPAVKRVNTNIQILFFDCSILGCAERESCVLVVATVRTHDSDTAEFNI